jgi:sec-independent protein translocase protein TatA
MLSPLVVYLPPDSRAVSMFGIGTTELIVIGIVILVLFGSRIPQTMKSLGQGLRQFKEGMNTDEVS